MAFAPDERTAPQLSATRRTVIFWLLMLALGALLWKMGSWQVGDELKYSDFMQQVDKNNVASAELLMGQYTGRMRGTLRAPAKRYRATVPKRSDPGCDRASEETGCFTHGFEAKDSTTGRNP